jgi:hypothetical protein
MPCRTLCRVTRTTKAGRPGKCSRRHHHRLATLCRVRALDRLVEHPIERLVLFVHCGKGATVLLAEGVEEQLVLHLRVGSERRGEHPRSTANTLQLQRHRRHLLDVVDRGVAAKHRHAARGRGITTARTASAKSI